LARALQERTPGVAVVCDAVVKKMRTTLLIAFGALSFSAAHAFVMIDDFSSGTYMKTMSSGNDQNVQSGTMLGGTRGTDLTVVSNPLNVVFDFQVGNGFLVADAGSALRDIVELRYGIGAGMVPVDLNSNLAGEDRFRLFFDSNDLNLNLDLTVRSGASSYTHSRVIAGGFANTPFVEDILFTSSGLAGMNWADVDEIRFRFSNTPSGDFAISQIQAVPEPGTILALGAGLAAVLRRRKSQKS